MNQNQAHLEENIVADNLVNAYKRIEPYSKLILAAIVAIVIVFIGIGLYRSDQTAKRSDATLQLLMENPEVSSQYPGTVAAAWSELFQANDNLAQGINALYQDRDEAETLLSQAKDQFRDARAASDDRLLLSRANFGLGMAAESLGELEEAIDAYKRCVEANESEQMVEIAQERADRLSKPQAEDFLAWFSDQDFSPADPSMPPELPGATSLPDLPDLDLPDLDLGNQMGGADSSEKPLEGGLELPATDGDSSPASDKSEETDNSSDGGDSESAAAPAVTETTEPSGEEAAESDASAAGEDGENATAE